MTGKYTGIPAFIGIMGVVFWLTFNVDRCVFTGAVRIWNYSFDRSLADKAMRDVQMSSSVVHSLVIDGIFQRCRWSVKLPADHCYILFLLINFGG
ncbi:MAG: hypothetical protein ACLTUL_20340 [Blautia faecis]